MSSDTDFRAMDAFLVTADILKVAKFGPKRRLALLLKSARGEASGSQPPPGGGPGVRLRPFRHPCVVS